MLRTTGRFAGGDRGDRDACRAEAPARRRAISPSPDSTSRNPTRLRPVGRAGAKRRGEASEWSRSGRASQLPRRSSGSDTIASDRFLEKPPGRAGRRRGSGCQRWSSDAAPRSRIAGLPAESHRKVDVLIAPAHEAHVEPVHRLEVSPGDGRQEPYAFPCGAKSGGPDRHAGGGRGRELAAGRESRARGRRSPRSRCDRSSMHGALRRSLKLDAGAREKPSRNRSATDRRDEVTTRDAVAVDEDEVVAARRRRAEIPAPRAVGSPRPACRGMDEPVQNTAASVDHRLVVPPGPVVGDDHLERRSDWLASTRSTASSASGHS